MTEIEDWMLVTKDHIKKVHGISIGKNSDGGKEHLISHIMDKWSHKHFSSDLKVGVR